MTKDLFNKADKIVSEINHLDMLMNYIEEGDERDDLMNPKYSDFAYLVYLLGTNNVLGFMRRRKKTLEKEFEEL